MRRAQLIPAAVVVVALGGLGAAAQFVHPAKAAAPAAAGRPVTVSSAIRACPPAVSGSGTVALIGGSSGPSSTSTGSTGQAGLTSLPVAGLPLRTVNAVTQTTPDTLSLLTVPASATTAKSGSTQKGAQIADGWSVMATGTMAGALEAEVANGSGLASLRCDEPGSDIWFVGPGQSNGAGKITLDLMNIDSLSATVNVSLITEAGPVQADGDTGITVPPHQTVTESLSTAGASSSVLAIDVHTSAGRVAADVSEGSSSGIPSWLPATSQPATRLVIPGVPAASSAAGLYLAVPGSTDAKVSVLAVTPQGQFKPLGTQTVDLPGQSASYLSLNGLGGTAAALVITANVPVTAAVLVPGSGSSGSGFGAFTAAAAPISEQAVIAGNTSGSGQTATAVLSAPQGAARVRLTEIATARSARKGAPATTVTASQTVSIRAGRTVTQAVTAPSGAQHNSAFALVITPLAGSGPVYAARVETRGSAAVSIIPADSALTTISLAPVRDSYDAIAP